ncbi:MAG: carbon storage regulator CsrA [Planctomycetaceae bacterium]|jgi:carbon storage regulator
MLVLSRQRDESIIIGENIVITVVDIRGDKVRLGIQAPTEIPVHRQEVYEAIQREQAKTQGTDTTTVDVALAKFPNRRPGKPAQ